MRPWPLEFGRYRYRSGFVARRSAEKTEKFRRLDSLVRETALGTEPWSGSTRTAAAAPKTIEALPLGFT